MAFTVHLDALGSRHCRTAVVQQEKDKLGITADRVDECRNGGVQESGITAGSHDRLSEAEPVQFAEAASHPDPGAHAMHGLELLEPSWTGPDP